MTNLKAITPGSIALVAVMCASLHASTVTVTDVVDGDTIIVDTRTRVQLLGLDAMGSAKGDYIEREKDWQATRFTTHFLKGKRVRLEQDPANRLKNHKDRWGRTLAYVYLEDGTFYNLAMIEQGYAVAYSRYRLKHSDGFKKAEGVAKKESRGLWKIARDGSSKKKGKRVYRKIFVARKGSKVFHEGSCLIAREIPLDERVTFHEKDEAIKLGYKSGRWCVPVLMKRFWGE